MKRLIASALLLTSLSASGNVPISHIHQKLIDETVLKLAMPEAVTSATPTFKPGVSDTLRPMPLQVARTQFIGKSLAELADWQIVNQTAILKLTLNAPSALHLNLGFEQINLPSSARLYLTDTINGKVLYQAGAMSSAQLWTPMYDGNQVSIEINVDHSEMDLVHLVLKQVGLGTKDVSSDSWLKSGSCNVDIRCPEGDNWMDVSRSVARYTISTDQGTFLCTGSLVNNDIFDQRPLILTAAHCGVAETTVDSMVFYWNYETSVCGATPDGSLTQSQTGARYISRGEGINLNSDFALVELNSRPDPSLNVYFSGWNAITQNAGDVVTIHHPDGDEKRISVDADPLTITGFDSEVVNEQANYYRITTWDVGTTEGGSSGAGLWNQEKEIIGTLSGGRASCTAPAASDWYGRLSSHWRESEHPLTQVAQYIAPQQSQQLAGLESCDAANATINSSIEAPAPGQTIDFSAEVTGGLAPYVLSWDFDADLQSDSLDPSPSHTYSTAGHQEVILTVTDASMCRSSTRIKLVVPDSTEQFLADGQFPANYVKTEGADATWVTTSDVSQEGTFSLRSQIINADQTSSISTTETYQAGSLTFSYRVSSEATHDSFKFYIDDVEQFNVSGEVDWTNVSYDLSAGSHTLRWEYSKDSSVSDGVDTAWIDNVVFTATPPPPPPPEPPEPRQGGGGGSIPLTLVVILSLLFIRRSL